MKKTIATVVCLSLSVLILVLIGIISVRQQKDYNHAVSQLQTLQADYEALQNDYNSLNEEYLELSEKTADWLKLTEEEKAAKLAQAEADRIHAEEAQKQAEEEQDAAEKAAAEEAKRKAEEEAAARAAEEKKGYETGITYNDLARNPDDFKGKKVKFTGQVLQVIESENLIELRLATKANSWGGYSDNDVYLYFDKSLLSSRILENDIITVYGTSQGLYSYETVRGDERIVPLIEVDKIDT